MTARRFLGPVLASAGASVPILHYGLVRHVGPGGTGVAFTPASLPGLVRWGKADGLGFANNDPIGTYPDLSTAGHDFVNTGTMRPLFKTNIQNGRSMLLFDGSDDYLACDGMAALFAGTNKPYSFFVVFKALDLTLDTGPTSRTLFGAADLTSGAIKVHWGHFLYAWGNCYMAQTRDGTNHSKGLTGGILDTTDFHTLIVTFDGVTKTIYQDGNFLAAHDQSLGATMTCNAVTYGAHRYAGGTQGHFNGYWGEDGIYDRALAADQVASLHSYLATRWGLAPVTLPWDPFQLQPNLRGWWREDSWYTLADGNAASTWYGKVPPYPMDTFALADLLGTGTYHTAVLNGRAAVLLDGTSNLWRYDDLAGFVSGASKPFTVFGAFKCTDLTPANSLLFGMGNSSDADVVHYLSARGTSFGNNYLTQRRDATGSPLASVSGGTDDTNLHSFVYIFNGTNVTLYIGGSIVINNQALTPPANCTPDIFTIAAWIQITTVQGWLKGYFGEAGFMVTAIGGADLTNLLAYLAARWGA